MGIEDKKYRELFAPKMEVIFSALFLSLIVVYFWGVDYSFAQNTNVRLESGIVCSASENLISANIVNCINSLLSNVATGFIGTIVSQVGGLVSIVAVLALIFLGIKVVFGLQQVQQQTVVFLIKLLIVIAVTKDADLLLRWYDYITSASQGLGNLIAGTLDGVTRSVGVNGPCPAPSGGTQNAIFVYYDCIVLKLLGIGVPGTSPNYWALAFIIGGLFFTGSLGALITLILISFVLVLVFSIIQSLFIYIVSIIAVTVLLGLTPVILPLILFERTKSIATEWIKHILVYSLQPVFLTVMLAMTLTVLNYFGSVSEAQHIEWYGKKDDPAVMKPLINLPEADLGAGNRQLSQAQSALASKVQASGKKLPPTSGAVSFWDVAKEAAHIALSKVTGGAVAPPTTSSIKRYATQLIANMVGTESVPILSMTDEELKKFLGLQIALLILLVLMISFLKQLPEMVSRMVGQGITTGITKYSGVAQRLGGSAMQSVAKITPAGRLFKQ